MLATRMIKTQNVLRKCITCLSTTVVPKEEKIKIGNYAINYLKVGHGEHHVLCTPGAHGSIWTDYKHQVDGFDREKFTVIFWDPPGFGKSRPPDRDFIPNYYDNDANVARQLMKKLNIPRYSLLGWCNGGVSSMVHAANHPDIIQNLVIWASNSFLLAKEVAMYKDLQEMLLWSRKMIQPRVELYGQELFESYWAKWVSGMEKLLKDSNGDMCSKLLPNITCPTFILYGDKDPIIDRTHLLYLQTHIKNAKTHVYPDGKHNIHIRYHEDFNQRVQEFLLTTRS